MPTGSAIKVSSFASKASKKSLAQDLHGPAAESGLHPTLVVARTNLTQRPVPPLDGGFSAENDKRHEFQQNKPSRDPAASSKSTLCW